MTIATEFGNCSNHRLVQQHTAVKFEKLQFCEVVLIASKAKNLRFEQFFLKNKTSIYFSLLYTYNNCKHICYCTIFPFLEHCGIEGVSDYRES